MDLQIDGRVALITGGAGGLGMAQARALAGEGVRLVINDLDPDRASEAVASLRQEGVEAVAVPGDVSRPDSAGCVVEAAVGAFGQLDILINNAGAGGRHLGHRVEAISDESWRTILDSHLTATFLCTRAALAHLGQAGYGRIINISSMNFTGGGRPGVAHYAAAKAGIAGFTRTSAKEQGPRGVTVNAIAPGYVESDLISGFTDHQRHVITSQNPIGRFCKPAEVGALAAYLCGRAADFINGALICIDGGKRDFHWDKDGATS
ncbi:SDR family oxidoreductase [Hoeflea sp. YIM 152468]|uniref:SDR family NAD(P)-dependent oxidoreductase n=1 Tax=Hoeflea sp. YIM 152468 TaxID=3031759 RepID=UPI0023DBE8A7|nr:SDR family oxidoreductase [Hoeflea sp. YIM 152468]MDF1610087.1 SDR family oxidoreductase [Hoeflea sp. YIM 152468]